MITNKLNVTSLDFNEIKASFIAYLKNQDTFKDYNFEASGLNALVELMAYNSHYQALMANFIANEMYMETAVKRSSVVSRAKELGYVPKSRSSAKLVVDLYTTATDSGKLNVGSVFSGSIDNNTYSFVTLSPYTGTLQSDGTYLFTNVVLYEGALINNTFTYDGNILTIPNKDVDITTIRVKDLSTAYLPVDNYINLTSSDTVFFVQEGFDSYYQIYFGDNVLGKSPDNGQTIYVSYLITSGDAANGINALSFPSDANAKISTPSGLPTQALGGAERENLDSIKLNAVNYYGVQNRAVTHLDYKSLIQTSGIQLNGLNCWGGEEEKPPKYGSIIVCSDPELTETQKKTITDLLKSKSVIGADIVFKVPNYNDIIMDVNATVDKTTRTASVTLMSKISSAIARYLQNSFSVFGGELKYSTLLTTINNADSAIKSNLVTIRLANTITLDMFSKKQFSIGFSNSLDEVKITAAVSSTDFYTDEYEGALHIEDDRKGNLFLYSADKTTYYRNVGTVNYQTGDVSFGPVNITSADDVVVYAVPASLDIVAQKNTIFKEPQIFTYLTFE